jgi:hypothetical protein
MDIDSFAQKIICYSTFIGLNDVQVKPAQGLVRALGFTIHK